MDLLTILQQSRMIEQALNIITRMQMFNRRQVREIKIHFNQFARRAVIAIGNLVGFLGRLGAAIAVNFERRKDPPDFLGGAVEGEPVFGGEGGWGVVIVELDVDVDGTGFLLLAEAVGKLGGVVGGDESEDVAEPVFLREATVFGGDAGGDAVEAGGGDGLDFLFERPLFGGRGVADEGPEVGDVGDGHGIFDF